MDVISQENTRSNELQQASKKTISLDQSKNQRLYPIDTERRLIFLFAIICAAFISRPKGEVAT